MSDRNGVLDLSDVSRLARMGQEMGLTQIWDLMHYGYPDDLDPLARPSDFIERFAHYAGAVATTILCAGPGHGPRYYTTINEISYYAWAAGDVGYMAPFGRGHAGELKRVLVQAAIAGIDAIWAVDPEAIMVNVDPLVRLHPPVERPDLQPQADFFNSYVVTEAFDMLCGRVSPELGGSRNHLGILGFNFYSTNQWTIPTPDCPQRFLEVDDPRWIPLHTMLGELQARYNGPLLLAETGSSGDARPAWISYLADEARACLADGVALAGICLYPVITSPDWEDPTAFFDGGLFDVAADVDGTLRRYLLSEVASALRTAQAELDRANLPAQLPLTSAMLPPQAAPHLWKPLERARFKPDNFSYQVLHAGEQLVVELICLEPGGLLPVHRHRATEHVWNVLTGCAEATMDGVIMNIQAGDALFVPAGAYHRLVNKNTERFVVQQVSAPKPWNARFHAPYPAGDV